MSDVIETHALETAVVDGHGLRCVFLKSGQMFTHVIQRIDGDTRFPLLAAEENSTGNWPNNPPWQELHVESLPSGEQVVMLVGQAGRSHWSMSVTVENEQQTILFDVACRVRDRPKFLGATYELIAPQQIAVEKVAVDGSPPASLCQSADRIAIEANIDVQPPATVRWAYRVALSK